MCLKNAVYEIVYFHIPMHPGVSFYYFRKKGTIRVGKSQAKYFETDFLQACNNSLALAIPHLLLGGEVSRCPAHLPLTKLYIGLVQRKGPS